MKLTIDGARWLLDGQPTHPGSPAEGLLMNVRMVNCVFEDDRPDPPPPLAGFDADANTRRFVDALPDYARHGIDAFTISLQGGMPGYEGAVNSAFEADGSLRGGYLDRVDRVIRAADASGCAVILSCLYQRQHSHARALAGRAAIRRAVSEAAGWVAAQGYGNVALEVANEFAHGGFARWRDGDWLRTPEAQVELIEAARSVAPGLLISTSGMGSGEAFEPVAEAGDFVLIHFNNTATDDIPRRIEASRASGKPVVCNEDDKTGPVGAEAARLSVLSGAGWGFMHSARNQSAPFRFDGGADDPVVYDMLRSLTSPGFEAGDPSTSPVFVLITSPKDGDRLAAGVPVNVRASVSGARSVDGARVRLLADDGVFGEALEPPWHVRWQAPPPGAWDLVAVLLDGDGQERARSRPVDVVVAG